MKLLCANDVIIDNGFIINLNLTGSKDIQTQEKENQKHTLYVWYLVLIRKQKVLTA